MNATKKAILVAAVLTIGLLLPGGADAASSVALDDDLQLRVDTRFVTSPQGHDGVGFTARPSKTALWFQILDTEEGEILEEGWVPGTQTGKDQHTSPTLGYDRWTRRAILAWTRGSLESAEIVIARFGEEGWNEPVALTDNLIPDQTPVLAIDHMARVHLVWWSPAFNGMVFYQQFHTLVGDPSAIDPEMVDLGLDWLDGAIRFPTVVYQGSTGNLFLAVAQSDRLIHVYRFAVDKGDLPSGGGSVVLPVSVAVPGSALDGVSTTPEVSTEGALRPNLTLVGEEELPALYWQDDSTLYYFTMEDGETASPVRARRLLAEYDDAGLESLVHHLIEMEDAELPGTSFRTDGDRGLRGLR